MLEIKNLSLQFGGLKALSNVSFEVKPDSITAIIGPNGAGKTTLFNLLTGVYTQTSGDILFNGVSLTGLKPHQIAKRGFARTFQNIRLFKSMSVLDQVRVACDRLSFSEKQTLTMAMDYLGNFGLESKAQEIATHLSYGDQRKLEIARALATGAQFLYLDEPAAGMNPYEKQKLMTLIQEIRTRFHLTIVLIEHDMKLVMGISEHVVVLDHGEKICEGPPSFIQQNPRVIEAYLGSKKTRKVA